MTARTVEMNNKSMTLTLLVVMHQRRHDGPHGWNEQEVYDTDLARGHAPATTWRPARLEWTRSLWHWPCLWSCTSDDMTARTVGMNKKSMTLTLLVVMHQRRHDGPHGWNEQEVYDTDLARGHAPATTWRPARLEWTRSLWHWPCSWSCTSDDMTARTVGMNKKSMTLTLLVVMHQWRHDGPHGWNEQEVYDTDLARGHAPATTWRPARLEWTRSLWHWPCSWSCTSDDMTARTVGMNKKSMTLTLLVVMHQRRHDGPHGWNEQEVYDTDLARGHAPATTWRPARLEWTRSLWHWPCSWSCTSDDMTARTVGMNKKSMTLTLLVVMHQRRHDGPHGWNEQEVYDTDLARGHAPATTWRPARLEWTRSLWHWPCSWSCTSDDMTARTVGMNKKSMTLTLLVVMHQRRHDGPHGWNE